MVAARRPKRPTAELEATAAQLERALSVLAQVLAVTPTTAFAYPNAQRALRAAQALLAEHGRGDPDRNATANALWLASKERR